MAGQPGKGTKATVLSSEFIELARHEPLRVARRAAAGASGRGRPPAFCSTTLKAQQFTLDGRGDVYVDGLYFVDARWARRSTEGISGGQEAVYRADALTMVAPVGRPRRRTTSRRRRRTAGRTHRLSLDKSAPRAALLGDCEAGARWARGARASAVLCRAGACVAVGPWTHVFDAASRPWLLPGIVTSGPGQMLLLEKGLGPRHVEGAPGGPSQTADLRRVAEVERHIIARARRRTSDCATGGLSRTNVDCSARSSARGLVGRGLRRP